MRLRSKTTLTIGIVFSLLGLLSGTVLTAHIGSGYGTLELEAQYRDAQLLSEALRNELHTMEASSITWAHWDEFKVYIEGRPSDFKSVYLNASAIEQIPVDTFDVRKADRGRVWSGTLNRSAGTIERVSPGDEALLSQLKDRFSAVESEMPEGFDVTKDGMTAAVALHILDNAGNGQASGYFTVLKRIDPPRMLERLGLGNARFAIVPVEAGSRIHVSRDSEGRAYALLALPSLFPEKSIGIRLASQDRLASEGKELRSLIYMSYLVMAGLLMAATYIIVDRTVLRRLLLLRNDLLAVHPDTLEFASVGDYGRDELGLVGDKANLMLRTLRESYKDLKRARQQVQEIADKTPVLIWMMTGDGVITFQNSTFLTYFGEDLTGSGPEQHLQFLHSDERREAARQFTALTRGAVLSIELQARLRCHDGRFLWHLISIAPIRDEVNGIVGFVASGTDIQAQRDAHDQLARSHALAVELGEAKSNFVAVVSHELRTPLNGILSSVHLLRSSDLVPQHCEELANIETSARHLSSIINDLLDFSRAEAKKLELVPEPFHVHRLIMELECLFRFPAEEKMIEMVLSISERTPPVLIGDVLRIKQILVNLIGNALKFTKPSGAVIALFDFVEGLDGKGVFCCSVSDSGPGISEDKQRSILEPFTQVDASLKRRFDGTGLGLAIANDLVTLHGGTLSVKSSLGVGSCFSFTLALDRGASGNSSTSVASVEQAAPGNTMDILLVEDNLINQRVAQKILSRYGHRVTVACNGIEAIEKLTASSFDLVFMDCHMPELDGISATRRIRALQKDPESFLFGKPLPIVAMTARAMEEDRRECSACGMDGFISKPIDVKELECLLKGFGRESGSLLRHAMT